MAYLKQISIFEATKMLNVSARTIRFYEERGLISTTRDKRNDRLISQREMEKLQFIFRAKRCGFTLSEILVAMENSKRKKVPVFSPAQIKAKRVSLAKLTAALEDQRRALENLFNP